MQSQTAFSASGTMEPADNVMAKIKALEEQVARLKLQEKESQEQNEMLQIRLQGTTLHELHEACHGFHSKFQVEQVKARRTQGTTTSPVKKPYPLLLREWKDFSEQRQRVFDKMLDLLPPDDDTRSRMFHSKETLAGMQKNLPGLPIGSEESLKLFHVKAVEDFLTYMFNTMAEEDENLGEKLGLKDQLAFTDHSNPLQDDNEEVLHRKAVNADQRATNQRATDQRATEQKLPSSMKADRLCYTIDKVQAEEKRQSLLVVELKAPHKFSQTILQRGLHPMNVKADVVNKVFIPTEPDELFEHQAKELVAAGLAQAYTYMLQTGLQYGCLETGESTVFLKVDEKKPDTLFFHLAIPELEVQQFRTSPDTNTRFPSSLTTLGQMSSFILMALECVPRSQDWRDAALKDANVWSPDEEEILRQIPIERVKPGVESPDFKSKALPALRKSPYFFRYVKSGCNDQPSSKTKDDYNDDDDDHSNQRSDRNKQPYTPTPAPGKGKNRQAQRDAITGKGGSSTNHQSRQYCTQLCLLGLVRGTKLDRLCPNVRAHRRGKKTGKHLLTQTRLCALIQKQLAISLARGLTDLDLQGSRGRLFKVTLLSHGYTFVAKGTRDVFVSDLHHEATIYQHLRPLQGDMIPVFLGNTDLEKKWWDLGYCISHMLLMSYGGESVDWIGDYGIEHRMIVEKMEGMGVSHEDLAERNTLWNPQTGKLMVIDFERSRIVVNVSEKVEGEKVKMTLGEITGNAARRRRRSAKEKLTVRMEEAGEENMGQGLGKRAEDGEQDLVGREEVVDA